jgi:hypothetical protein
MVEKNHPVSCIAETNIYKDEEAGRVSDNPFYILQLWIIVSHHGENRKLGGEIAYKNIKNYSPEDLNKINLSVIAEGEKFPRTYVDDPFLEQRL